MKLNFEEIDKFVYDKHTKYYKETIKGAYGNLCDYETLPFNLNKILIGENIILKEIESDSFIDIKNKIISINHFLEEKDRNFVISSLLGYWFFYEDKERYFFYKEELVSFYFKKEYLMFEEYSSKIRSSLDDFEAQKINTKFFALCLLVPLNLLYTLRLKLFVFETQEEERQKLAKIFGVDEEVIRIRIMHLKHFNL